MIPETLTIVERQILANQFKILSKITDQNEEYEVKIEILENGYTEQYYEIFEVDTEEIPVEICEETSQILNMFRRINNALDTLSEEEKEDLDLKKLKFEGFDAHNDTHYYYMNFMVKKMHLWREYKSENLNSQSSFSILKYRKMLEYQNYLLENDQYDLNKEDLKCMIELLNSSKKIISLAV